MSAPATLAPQTGHIGLNVTDLERSLPFYTRVLGLQLQAEGKDEARRWAFLGRDGRLVLTLWQQGDAGFSAATAGLHHLSFEVGAIEEVEAAERLLRELGAEFRYDGVVPHGEGVSSGGIFFLDPDGIRLEIYAPSGADTAPAPSGAAPTCGFF
ncbi:VOC family protein [Streptomyces sp. TRM 70351]|uniref:VOC family protein n=1 Tax=Streptomyces sp. TRM 70351 TaxID=3116552 RepID=UPI002E7C4879|nr:VOC family protein [Streptomyces sp. TRM 70351]MEE1930091.1 VOC family protein [Streptomyces sp. TRM 70351]